MKRIVILLVLCAVVGAAKGQDCSASGTCCMTHIGACPGGSACICMVVCGGIGTEGTCSCVCVPRGTAGSGAVRDVGTMGRVPLDVPGVRVTTSEYVALRALLDLVARKSGWKITVTESVAQRLVDGSWEGTLREVVDGIVWSGRALAVPNGDGWLVFGGADGPDPLPTQPTFPAQLPAQRGWSYDDISDSVPPKP